MKGLLATVMVAAGVATAKNIVPTLEYEFEHFVQDFGREFSENTEEWEMRREIFYKNREFVMEQNKAHAEGRSTWHAALNKFGDHTEEEMKRLRGYQANMGRRNLQSKAIHNKMYSRSVEDLPTRVDWREKGVMTPPKDQGGCGSCWAFASTAVLESHVAINTNQPPMVLSPQQYVNCASNPYKCGGTGGCQGATAEVAFNYTKAHGLPLLKDVPYTGRNGLCNRRAQPAATVTGYHQITPNDDAALAQAVANVGPVSISVAAKSWGFYFGGVFDGPNGDCDAEVDHAVVLAGYGVEGARTDYWLVRNSWGPDWGEKGYIRIKRIPGNEPCKVDPNPKDGICGEGPCACDDPVTYCGVCAILADSVIPTGAGLPN